MLGIAAEIGLIPFDFDVADCWTKDTVLDVLAWGPRPVEFCPGMIFRSAEFSKSAG